MTRSTRRTRHAILIALITVLVAACTPPPPTDGDTTAPTVSLSSSATAVTEAGPITLTADASDDVGVTEVEFYRGGTLLRTDDEAPYEAPVELTAADNGDVTFRAVAYDAAGNTAEDSVTVSVAISTDGPGNDPPVAQAQTVATAIDTPVDITLTGTDPEDDELTFAIASDPASGTLSGDAPNLTYTPDAGFEGQDSFTFTVSDGEFTSEAATVTIFVGSADGFSTFGNTMLIVDPDEANVPSTTAAAARVQRTVLDNDAGTDLTVTDPGSITTTTEGGTVVMEADGSFTYQPPLGYTGPDSFDYTNSAGDTVTVTIDVGEVVWYVNSAATAAADGTSAAPFATIDEAETASAAGDTIYIFGGTEADPAPTYTQTINVGMNQTIMGQGVALELAGMTVVAAGRSPVITPLGYGVSLGHALATEPLVDVGDVAIRGITLTGTGAEGGSSIDGNNIAGSVTIEDVVINDSLKHAIHIDHNNTTEDPTYEITIRNVEINNPLLNGIQTDDAESVVVEDSTISGITGTSIEGSGNGGYGIDVQNEYGGTVRVSGVTINSTSADARGFRLEKNGRIPGSSLEVALTLENNTINLLEDTGVDPATWGILIYNNENGEAEFASTGTIVMAGTGNTVTAVEAFACDDAMDDPATVGTGQDAVVTGSIGVNGVERDCADGLGATGMGPWDLH